VDSGLGTATGGGERVVVERHGVYEACCAGADRDSSQNLCLDVFGQSAVQVGGVLCRFYTLDANDQNACGRWRTVDVTAAYPANF
jgi:hypothetical protein